MQKLITKQAGKILPSHLGNQRAASAKIREASNIRVRFISGGTEKDRKRMKTRTISKKQEAPASKGAHDPRPLESPPTNSIVRLKKILVPVDLSDCSKKALQYANTFARQFGGELIILHVIEPHQLVPESASYDFENSNDTCEDLQELQRLIDNAISSSISIRTGTPHVKIVEAARGLGADLIIISTHSHKSLDRMFVGSTTEKVVRSAPCPVLVVRECEHDFIGDYAWAFEMTTNNALIGSSHAYRPTIPAQGSARP
jgi:nucleotide-binding universal stress UspA family protein